jgi:hypothetical protein
LSTVQYPGTLTYELARYLRFYLGIYGIYGILGYSTSVQYCTVKITLCHSRRLLDTLTTRRSTRENAAMAALVSSAAAPFPGTAAAAGQPPPPATTTTTISGGAAPATRQAALVIAGAHTEVLRTTYGNAEMWVVTQVGRIGAVVRASKVASSDSSPIVVCRTLFGKRDDATHDLFARVLAERVIAATGAPLTLAFALKPDVDVTQLKAIVELCCTLL